MIPKKDRIFYLKLFYILLYCFIIFQDPIRASWTKHSIYTCRKFFSTDLLAAVQVDSIITSCSSSKEACLSVLQLSSIIVDASHVMKLSVSQIAVSCSNIHITFAQLY